MSNEVVEAKPVTPQRFMHQCSCGAIKFEIFMIQEGVVKSMILVCSKGHKSIMKNVPAMVESNEA